MITIHNISEMIAFYTSLGGERKQTQNGFCYLFPSQNSYVKFWGDLNGFSLSDANFTYKEDAVIRSQFSERYIGIGLSEEGSVETYTEKKKTIQLGVGVNCFVFDSPIPFFMRVKGGECLKFKGLYFQERFFLENKIPLYDSFWQDAKNTIHGQTLHTPELTSIFKKIEQSRLTGAPFATFVRGVGLEAAAILIDLVQKRSSNAPIYLDKNTIKAVENAKELLDKNLQNPPTICELSKRVGVNKNKLQEGFKLTEGKSIATYIRTIRMEKALDLLENKELTMNEIAKSVGYSGISNFYRVFHQTFGSTPAMIQKL